MVTLAGEKTRCFMFTYRLSFSGAAVHRVYASQGQEAFIEGHLEAFRVLGVPTVHIRYDNQERSHPGAVRPDPQGV